MFKLFVAGIVLVLASNLPASAQSGRARQWVGELSTLAANTGSIETRSTAVALLHQEIADWLALNPAIDVTLTPLPVRSWTDGQLAEEIAALRRIVSEVARKDPNQPFYLGATAVQVTASTATLSPVVDSLDGIDIRERRALTVAQAIEYLPGVSVDHKAPRNQSGISIGGFDSRQVPLYLDGIPAYVPFDGYVDLSRYLTSDVSEVQVSKGFSSALLGPNVLGGVVNVVTRQPRQLLEGDAFLGTAAGHLFETGLHAGTRWDRWFAQGSTDRLQSDFYPIAGSFPSGAVQQGDRRVNSDQRDDRYRLRLGWTPRGRDEYVLSVSSQDGQTGVPPYSGSAPSCPTGNTTLSTPCVTPKFWRWPYWDTDSYYLNANTGLGASNTLQLRAVYARYNNRLDMFDDSSYGSMNLNASSGMTANKDHSVAASGTFDTIALSRHAISASFFVKQDTHTEQTTTFSRSNLPTTTPVQEDRDRQSSFGIEDVWSVASALRVQAGISADQLAGLAAQDLSADRLAVVPFQVAGICGSAAAGFESCTDRVWTYNPSAAVTLGTQRLGALFFTASHKSRFPTIKDRYSYKAGRAVPNPMLRPERATTWTAGYSRALAARTVVQVDLFRSDVRDEIENISFLSPLCAGGGRGGAGTCQQAVNVGSETHDGVNVVLRSTALARLTVDASYGFLQREISGTPGVFPTGTPRHKFIGVLTGRLPIKATANLSIRHLSGIAAMSDNGLPLPAASFTVLDAGAIVPIHHRLSVQGGVKNLTDRNYYYWEGFPEAGRSGYVTLRLVF